MKRRNFDFGLLIAVNLFASFFSYAQSNTAPVTAGANELVVPDHFPRLCRRFALLLENRHYLQKPFSQEVSAQAWTNYLNMLDYDRSYFIQSDIEILESWKDNLCKNLKDGDLSFPIKAFEIFKKRLNERSVFTENFLALEPDFTADETYTWKRKDMPWPKDHDAQNDLWRKRLKNELLGRIVSEDFAVSNKSEKVENKDALTITNAADSAMQSVTVSTNAPSLDMSPQAVISRRYKQYGGIIQDADADWVIERFLTSFAAVYDPHSSYMSPPSVDDFEIDMNLKLVGIGATLQSEDGMAKIVAVMPGGPADRDTRDIRLRENDKIFAVGQGDGPAEDIVHLPLNKIVKRIRGEKGSKVVLHVISASDPSGNTTKIVDLIRDEIKLEESAATGRVVRVSIPTETPAPILSVGNSSDTAAVGLTTNLTERVFGYVKLPSFYGSVTMNPNDPNFRSCTIDVQKQIAKFSNEVEGMVLDLRDNGGGSLREAVMLAGSFIRTGPVVLVRESGGAQPFRDLDPSIAFRKPMIVMINKASASASEIVAAAMQDYGRALIVGDSKSHGKGSVQNVMELIPNDEKYGSLKLTIAAFYRINGSSTQNRGVYSDIVLPSILEHMDIGEDKLPHALPWSSIPPMHYSLVYPIGSAIPTLRAKSAGRLADNEEWKKHMALVEHWKNVSERKSVPLNYAKRYALVESDAKVGDKTVLDDDDDFESQDKDKTPEDGIGDDIVLRETFNILADLIDIQGKSGISPSQDADPSDWIFRFVQ